MRALVQTDSEGSGTDRQTVRVEPCRSCWGSMMTQNEAKGERIENKIKALIKEEQRQRVTEAFEDVTRDAVDVRHGGFGAYLPWS